MCIRDSFTREGTLPAGATRLVAQTAPYDHCNMTIGPGAPSAWVERFGTLLRSMSYADPDVRLLLDLEGLKEWCEGRVSGYAQLEAAVDAFGFYDEVGRVSARDYRP